MDIVFYVNIRPAVGQRIDQVITKASRMGYTLMRFEGYSDADIGPSGEHGPKWAESRANMRAIQAIQDACVVRSPEGEDWPHITHNA